MDLMSGLEDWRRWRVGGQEALKEERLGGGGGGSPHQGGGGGPGGFASGRSWSVGGTTTTSH